jgi:hypothetical protein
VKQRLRHFTCVHCGKKNAFDPATVRSKHHLTEQVQGDPTDSLIVYLPKCRSCGQENEVAPLRQPNGTPRGGKRSPGSKPTARRGADASDFWHPKRVEELAAEQGVQPIADPRELRGDFWPPGESTDEFLTWLRKLRQDAKGNR